MPLLDVIYFPRVVSAENGQRITTNLATSDGIVTTLPCRIVHDPTAEEPSIVIESPGLMKNFSTLRTALQRISSKHEGYRRATMATVKRIKKIKKMKSDVLPATARGFSEVKDAVST